MFSVRNVPKAAGLAALALVATACGGAASEAGSEGGGGDDSASSGCRGNPTTQIRATNLLPPDNAQSDLMQWFLDELEAGTDGEVETEVVYGGALVPGDDTLAGLQQGRAEAGNLVPAYFPAELPYNNINMVPIPDGNQAARVRALQQLAEESDPFAQEFEDNEIKLVGYLPNPSSAVAVTDNVSTIDDLQGMSIRIPAQPASAVYEELGVEPVFMPSEEVYESVERGLVDGVTYPMDVEVATGVTEVAKYMAPDVGQNGGSIFAIAQCAYDGLSEDAKAVFDDLQGQWFEQVDQNLQTYEAQACEEFLSEDGTVVLWPEEDQQRLAELTSSVAPDVWKQEVMAAGADQATVDELWDSYTSAVEELSTETDYTDGLQACGEQQ